MIAKFLRALLGLDFLKLGMGGGGGGSSTSYQTNVPEYAADSFMDLVGRAEALTQAPYQPYTGERAAQFTPLQKQAFQGATTLGPSGAVDAAAGLAGAVGTRALAPGASFTTPGTSGSYMSPYASAALQPQLREADRASDILGQKQNAQAVSAGAFGGSRDALVRSERERNLMLQKGDIMATGLQKAYESGRDQFNTEQNQNMQRLQAGLGAAGALTTAGNSQFGQKKDAITTQQALGTQQQQQVQGILDTNYADFQNQRNYPYQQLGFMGDVLRGTAGTTRTMYESGPSTLQTVAGLGTAAAGASRLFGAAEGGEIPSFADGGPVAPQGIAAAAPQQPQAPAGMPGAPGQVMSPPDSAPQSLIARLRTMDDQQLAQMAQLHRTDPMTFPLVVAENAARQRVRSMTAAAQPPQPTVADQVAQQMGVGAQPMVVDEPAPGGVAGFSKGGETEDEVTFGDKAGAVLKDVTLAVPRGLAGAMNTALIRPARALGSDTPYISFAGAYDFPIDESDPAPEWTEIKRREAAAAARAQQPAPSSRPPFSDARSAAAAPQATPQAAPAALPPAGGGGLAAIRAPGFKPMTAEEYMQSMTKLTGDMEADPEVKALRAIDAEQQQSLRDSRERARGVETEQAAIHQQRGERLEQRQGALDKEGARNEAMAFIQAGLGMLTSSRRGIAGIADGAGKGFAAYEAGIEKIKAAQERLDQAHDALADAKLGSKKEAVAAENALAQQLIQSKKEVTAAVAAATGRKRGEVAKGLELASKDRQTAAEIAARVYAAKIDSNKQVELVKFLMSDPKALETFQNMQERDPGFLGFYKAALEKSFGDPAAALQQAQTAYAESLRAKGGLPPMMPPR